MYPYLINTDNAAMESSSHDFKIKAVHAKTIFYPLSRQASDVQLYWGVSRLEYKTLFIIQYSQTFNWDKIKTTEPLAKLPTGKFCKPISAPEKPFFLTG